MTEKQIAEQLHEEFLQRAKNYQTSESKLIETILKVDAKKSFQHLGYSSLHSYCTLAIGLSDSHAYALISVARKSRIVPGNFECKKMPSRCGLQRCPHGHGLRHHFLLGGSD